MMRRHFTLFIFILVFVLLTVKSASLLGGVAQAGTDVREVSASSCDIIQVNLGLGMTTQIVLEQEPKVTLYADKKHFKITTTSLSPRSLAIIPFVESSEIEALQSSQNKKLSPKGLASELDKSLKTNLFVFFDNSNQLMFQLRFVEKNKADYIVMVKQLFKKGCGL